MQKVYLKGNLAQFGEVWNMNVSKLSDVFKLISCQTPDFKPYIINCLSKGVRIEIVKGSEILDPSLESLIEPLKKDDLIITEVPAGAEDPIDFFVAAIAVLVVGPWVAGKLGAAVGAGTTATAFINTLAINLAITGISLAMAPGPEVDIPDQFEEEQKAKLFNGPANVTKQGIPIPLLYGELMIGGATIHSSLNIPDVPRTRVYQNKMVEVIAFGK